MKRRSKKENNSGCQFPINFVSKVAKNNRKNQREKCEELVRVVVDDRSTLTINLTRIITFDESPTGLSESTRWGSMCNKNIRKTMIYCILCRKKSGHFVVSLHLFYFFTSKRSFSFRNEFVKTFISFFELIRFGT